MAFLFRFLYRNLKGYRSLVLFAILVSFANVAVEILAALPLKYIPAKLQNPTDPNNDPDRIWSGFVSFFDRFASGKPPTTTHTLLGVILFSAVLLIVATLLDSLLGYVQLYLAAFIGQNLTSRLRKRLFEQIQRLSLDWHGKQKKGDLVQRVTGNISDVEKFVTDGLVDLLTGVLTIFGVAAVMFMNSAPYTLLSVVIVPALALVVFSYTTSIKAASKQAAKAASEVADVAVEDVGAITVIKAFDLVERETDRFNRHVDKTRRAGLRAGGLQAQFTPLVTVLVGIGTSIIIGVGAYVASGQTFHLLLTIPSGSINIGTVVIFITLLGKLFQPMKDLSKLTNVATSAIAGAERIQDIFDQAPEVIETRVPYSGPQTLRGELTFEQVTFGYTPEKLILKGITLHIPAGKKVALVGLSGGGKTTLVKLIPRFYETTGGRLLLDGRDTHDYPLSLLRQNVGMVLQESVLFEGTILENLKIGRPHATLDEIVSATRQAHIHDTIMSWPQGYGTPVRNQGKNFSGGQRQRMAIARALLSKAPILILDEPTAALDVEAELEVMKALDQLVIGRTVLMISHRLSTLGKVDEIIVLKEGRIVEQGTYKDLKSRSGGVFADLLGKQKQYDMDYQGGSIIIPQAEFVNIAGSQPATPVQVGASEPHNGQPSLYRARMLVEVNMKQTGEYLLDRPEMRIGRLPTNDIPVPSGRVSRLHARIRQVDRGWMIEDLQSLNGLNYQGELVERHRLTAGDRVYLAPTVVLIYQEEARPTTASVRVYPPPSVPRLQIVIEMDGQTLAVHPLAKETITIGRQPENDVQIPSQLISGKHALLIVREGTWLLIDRGSRNGLTYQGARVQNHRLANGDCVFLAPRVMLRFEQG
jgi:ABC-type multidrug transport system fused ATPase/permease subunit/pSer/pThr/pTyr-binding forkhead associated (FHA) protein